MALKDYQEIESVLHAYLEAGNTSGAALKPLFHPNATVNAEPLENFLAAVDQAGPAQAVGRVDILSVQGNTACAKVEMENWHGMNFTDLHTLIKTDSGWKIICKVYTQNA